jgi:uncharacterized protein YfaS (alpha-2-macroglobulin family)
VLGKLRELAVRVRGRVGRHVFATGVAAPITQKIEIQREFHDADGKVIDKTTMGSEIEVHLKIRTLNKNSWEPNVAIVDLLPGGFEVVMNEPEKASASESEESGGNQPPRVKRHASDEEDGEGDGESEEHSDEDAERSAEKAATHKEEGGGDSYWSSTIAAHGSTWTPQYVDVREDRVLLFGSFASDVSEFVYKIRATNKAAALELAGQTVRQGR